jgi:hypothetical protein
LLCENHNALNKDLILRSLKFINPRKQAIACF